MLEINKVSYHDKKKNKRWFGISATHNNINCYGISETKEDYTKINFLNYISYTPEEKNIMDLKGIKEGQEVKLTKQEESKLIDYIENQIEV